ncbi:MAG: PDZ domain-containing protein [Planctomycetota bacterium]
MKTLTLLVFTAGLCWCGAVFAQPRDTLLDDLDHDDYDVRREATESMLLDETLTTDRLAAWYALADSLEAQQRLLIVARHHFLRELRLERFPGEGPGSIGVVQSIQVAPPPPNADGRDDGPNARPPARATTFALVTRVLDGFPAAGRLRPLDRVVAVDGQTLGGPGNNQRFEDLMRRYRANQSITLTVQRDGQTVDVVITLANGNALGAMYAFPDFGLTADFEPAWVEHQLQHFPSRQR